MDIGSLASKDYNWVLDPLSYNSIDTLIKALKPAIIDPAIQKHNELRLIKAREPNLALGITDHHTVIFLFQILSYIQLTNRQSKLLF